jgi:nucleoside phosphorylase
MSLPVLQLSLRQIENLVCNSIKSLCVRFTGLRTIADAGRTRHDAALKRIIAVVSATLHLSIGFQLVDSKGSIHPATDRSRPKLPTSRLLKTMSLVDFLIVTPLDQEWVSARKVLRKRMYKKPVRPTIYYLWTHPLHKSRPDDAYLVVGAAMPKMGQTNAAAFVTAVIKDWKPRYIIMIGIAGGLAPKTVALGDVVVPETIHGYVLGDVTGRKADFTFRPTQDRTGVALFNEIRHLRNDPITSRAWKCKCLAGAGKMKLQLGREPELHLADIASGNKVVKSTNFARRLRDLFGNKTLAVEMEGQGLMEAIYQSAEPRTALMVRGISDYANTAKSKLEKTSKQAWRKLAAANAARLVRMLLNEKPDNPISPLYKLHLKNESGAELLTVPREYRLMEEGAQNLLFRNLISRSEPTPSLKLTLHCKRDSEPILPNRARCTVWESNQSERPVPPEDNGVFKFPAAETGIRLDLFLAFKTKVDQVEVSCVDDFGRNVKATWASKVKT